LEGLELVQASLVGLLSMVGKVVGRSQVCQLGFMSFSLLTRKHSNFLLKQSNTIKFFIQTIKHNQTF
jgi:hypothetical protein